MEFSWAATWGPIATGCKDDYISVNDGTSTSVRLFLPGDESKEHEVDALGLLQAGVPVMYYSRMRAQWERRVMKVDNRLNFLYILGDDASQARWEGVPANQVPTWAKLEAWGPEPPRSVKVDHIVKVLKGVDALTICGIFGISDPHLNQLSAVVVQIGDAAAELPRLEHCMVLMGSPNQNIPKLLQHLIDKAPKMGEGVSEIKKLVQEHNADDDVDEKPLQKHLNGISLGDVLSLFDDDTDNYQIELSFKDSKTMQYITLPGELPFEHVERLAAAAGKEFELLHMDVARIQLALKDIAGLRDWAQRAVPTTFDHRLPHLLLDEESVKNIIHRNADFDDAVRQCEAAFGNELGEDEEDPESYCAHASGRSAQVALYHLLALEASYNDIVRRCFNKKRLKETPPGMMLSGDPVAGERLHAGFKSNEKTGELTMHGAEARARMRAARARSNLENGHSGLTPESTPATTPISTTPVGGATPVGGSTPVGSTLKLDQAKGNSNDKGNSQDADKKEKEKKPDAGNSDNGSAKPNAPAAASDGKDKEADKDNTPAPATNGDTPAPATNGDKPDKKGGGGLSKVAGLLSKKKPLQNGKDAGGDAAADGAGFKSQDVSGKPAPGGGPGGKPISHEEVDFELHRSGSRARFFADRCVCCAATDGDGSGPPSKAGCAQQ
eukprot:gnl/TRDRNA2_/TRDRNA2_43563_c0_seq1.p1 gnl/TRDRNA2_/TRDRNA2_43563_c0~~gnl/TRDRNA2_/TRDRNA2_43563_c0_seq1.p1  ORF type:complete len:668 (+),score=130.04 gnl/TRDRNA2_/TRDRNA2_43563_c0_seq1:137-2140(+)